MNESSASNPSLRLEFHGDAGGWTLRDAQNNSRLMVADSLALLIPVIDGRRLDVTLRRAVDAEGNGRSTLSGTAPGVGRLSLEIFESADDAIDLRCSFTPEADVQLNALEIFPERTAVLMDDVVNFRNRHFTTNTWPELLLGGRGCETTTFSDDWQFAPHPSMMMLRKAHAILFVGCLDLPTGAFGMELAAAEHRLKHLRLQYGAYPNGMRLAAGQTFVSPRIRLFLRHGAGVFDALDEFTAMLLRSGQIPYPAVKTRHRWWREPLYCTWIDQTFAAEVSPPMDLREQAKLGSAGPAQAILDEAFVRRAVERIRAERLPFRTILIDDGWQVARGQWEPQPDRFPDFRRLVDDLHAAGFKVVVWWNWAEIEAAAEADPSHLFGGGTLNRHGCRVRDYSMPRVQEEYLRPLFRKLFSSAPGCYDLDGVKTDFLADKVHPELMPFDPTWRGEEAYFFKLTALFDREMKRHKPDAVHIGCAGHFWLAEHIDINRTYDIWMSPLEHEARAQMLRHTAPGVPIAYDFYNFVDGLDASFDSAERTQSSIQIGNVLYVRDDAFAPPRVADAAYYELLRQRLPRSQFA